MIFYFSGTGNSLWIAKQVCEVFQEKLLSISDELNQKKELTYSLHDEEKVFFIFPVHSWGPAVPVMRFLKRMQFENYHNQPIYMIATCGDECGYTNDIFRVALSKQNLSLTAAYSVIMPNNYILMKGFDVDSKELEEKKLREASYSLGEIVATIQDNNKSSIYHKGKLAYLKSYLIYPLFRKFTIGKNHFYAKENCTSCGLCIRICPTQTIEMKGVKPFWSKTCVQCTACIHRCPVNAIEYGKISVKKGRYRHPDL